MQTENNPLYSFFVEWGERFLRILVDEPSKLGTDAFRYFYKETLLRSNEIPFKVLAGFYLFPWVDKDEIDMCRSLDFNIISVYLKI